MTPGSFELTCAITIEDVPDVRRIVEKLHGRLMRNGDDVSRVAMATHELLENAVKFSADGTASLKIEIVDGSQVRITTRNLAREQDLAGIASLAKEIESVTDAMSFYLELMERSPDSRGGLGLGRIAAEGEMQVAIELDANVVEVHAISQLTQPLAA